MPRNQDYSISLTYLIDSWPKNASEKNRLQLAKKPLMVEN